MFAGTLTHAAFSRTLYVYLDSYDEASNAKYDSRSASFLRKLTQNAITASYLGTFNFLSVYFNEFIKVQKPLLHTSSLYTATAIGAAFIAVPLIAKVIEYSPTNEKAVDYAALAQKITNTIAKIVNVVFTVLYVHTAFGPDQALITGLALTHLTFTAIKDELLRFDFDFKMS